MAKKAHYKIFNGRRYQYAISNPTKLGAMDFAREIRKKGKFVGVVGEIDKNTGKTIWSVYTRNK